MSTSPSSNIIGIAAATGQLGRLVISSLLQVVSSERIVALVRSPDKAKDLGVKVVEADYSKPDTLDKALHGINTLLLISSNVFGQRAAHHTNVIEAAKKSGVTHIVYTSLLHADSTPLGLAKEHVETEVVLKNAGVSYTILRNDWYNENYNASIPGALQSGAWIGSTGNGKISAAARQDYAEAAVQVLKNPIEHVNKIYELAGDEAFTLTDLAAELSKQTGKTIPYRDLPTDEYAGILIKVGIPESFAHFISQTEYESRNDALYDDAHTLSKLIGRKTTPLATTIAKAIKA